MVKRIIVVTVAACTLALPAVVAGDNGGTPNRHNPAAQCRHAGLSPEANRRAFASCVRDKARGRHSESRNPAAQCRRAGLSPEVNSRAFASCVHQKATGQQSESENPAAQCLQDAPPEADPLGFASCVQEKAR